MEIYQPNESSSFSLPPSLKPTHHSIDYHARIVSVLDERRKIMSDALANMAEHAEMLNEVAQALVATLRSGHKILIAGNGGSAAESQHFAAELVGRFKKERKPYAAIALTTDSAIITAIANDYGYQEVFARQIRGLGQADDLLILFSTSGESANIVQAAHAARQCKMCIAAVTGARSSQLATLADIVVQVPVVDTAVIQELHMVITHILCDIAEWQLSLSEDEVNNPYNGKNSYIESNKTRSHMQYLMQGTGEEAW